MGKYFNMFTDDFLKLIKEKKMKHKFINRQEETIFLFEDGEALSSLHCADIILNRVFIFEFFSLCSNHTFSKSRLFSYSCKIFHNFIL